MNRKPYTFPHRSRKAMIEYLLADRRGYYSQGDGEFPFAWNVKAHGVNWEKPKGEYPLNPSLDSAWAKYVSGEGADYVCENAFEQARNYYTDDWTSYPGDDQGDWRFLFLGRSAGHLCLASWRGYKFANNNDTDTLRGLFQNTLPLPDLRKFYIGIRCADSDFTRDKANTNVEYAVNWIRHQWEEATDADQERQARCLEASRPDMYAGA